jgi:spectinomycin phosphotransferase
VRLEIEAALERNVLPVPGMSARIIGYLPYNTPVLIVCTVLSDSVTGPALLGVAIMTRVAEAVSLFRLPHLRYNDGMREPPALDAAAIVGALGRGFGVEVRALEFLPVGEDADSWSYRVEAVGGPVYFLKVRSGAAAGAPGAVVPDYLRRRGVPGVLAPLPARDDTPAVQVEGYALMLYPMIEGETAAGAGLSPRQWRELGAVVRRVHATPLTPELTRLVGREPFRPSRRERMAELEAAVAAGPPADPAARALAGCWRPRHAVIRALVERADTLGRRLEREPFPLVLCHADLHTWNVLVDTERRLWIVDWDEAILAPRERDLMFVVGGIVGGLVRPADTECFLQGYGDASVDQRLLAYYRLAWAVQDIAAYAEQALRPDLGAATRLAAVDGFGRLFAPGNIVALAWATP